MVSAEDAPLQIREVTTKFLQEVRAVLKIGFLRGVRAPQQRREVGGRKEGERIIEFQKE